MLIQTGHLNIVIKIGICSTFGKITRQGKSGFLLSAAAIYGKKKNKSLRNNIALACHQKLQRSPRILGRSGVVAVM